MNCARCNAPLDTKGRFCHNCGLPIAASSPVVETPTSPPSVAEADDTVHITSMPKETETPSTSPAPRVPETSISAQPTMPSPSVYYQTKNSEVRMPPATVNTLAPQQHRRGYFLGCLIALVVLLLVVGAGWTFVLRPYLHNLAEQQIDQAISSAIAQIPPQAAHVPSPLRVQDLAFNNLITSNIAPTGPVQQTKALFTPQGVRLDFQLYGYPCTITGVPQTQHGQLIMQGLTVQGIVSLILSPGDMQQLLDKQLQNAQARLQRSITQVSLQEHEIDLFLS